VLHQFSEVRRGLNEYILYNNILLFQNLTLTMVVAVLATLGPNASAGVTSRYCPQNTEYIPPIESGQGTCGGTLGHPCAEKLCGIGLECVDSTCVCDQDLLVDVSGKCYRKRNYTCIPGAETHMDSCIPGMECVDELCKCQHGSVVTEDQRHCEQEKVQVKAVQNHARTKLFSLILTSLLPIVAAVV